MIDWLIRVLELYIKELLFNSFYMNIFLNDVQVSFIYSSIYFQLPPPSSRAHGAEGKMDFPLTGSPSTTRRVRAPRLRRPFKNAPQAMRRPHGRDQEHP
ncbi:MAG: hypothetical protein SWE60_11920 [Thermodesulfobacteriota bacterium]|nr:hypothetical protein [Thermodesulfobacteriota bacterium]